MTSYEQRGRKVVDPKPVRPNYGSRNHPASGLEMAWEEMDKAKSVLHRAEFNLREVDYPPAKSVASTSIMMDKVPKYCITDKPVKEQVIIDRYGRTSHLKAKLSEGKRKIAHSDGRYHEDESELDRVKSRKPSPLREANLLHPSEVKIGSNSYSSKITSADDVSDLTEKYNEKYKKTEHDDTSRKERYLKHSKDNGHDAVSLAGAHKTDVKFINDFSDLEPSDRYMPTRLTKVPVTVPSVPTTGSHGSKSSVASVRSSYSSEQNGGAHLDHVPKSGSHRLKEILKTADPNNDGLSKVRELVKRQRLAASRHDKSDDPTLQVDLHNSVPELTQRVLHKPDEPVKNHHYDIYIDQPPPLPARKVATGCRVPSYRGFSEIESLHNPSSRNGRISDSRRKTSRPSTQPQLQPAAQPPVPKHHPRDSRKTGENKPEEGKKLTRVIAQKRPAKSEVITTHSWREGQKAILKELGPQKVAKVSNSPPTTDRNTDKTDQNYQHAKKLSGKEHSQTNGHIQVALSAEAQSVLDDLDRNRSDEEYDEKSCGKREARSSHRKRSRTPEKETGTKPQNKVRHYDSNEVRKYIAKQRAEKRRRQQEEEEKRRKIEEDRQKMLKELYKKQKARARAAQPKSDNVQFKLDPPDPKHKIIGESDKENHSANSSDSSTLTEISGDDNASRSRSPNNLPKQDINTELLLKRYLGESVSSSGQSEVRKIGKHQAGSAYLEPDTRLKAGEIVREMTKKSGLSVDDIISKYASQAEAIKSTFTTHDLSPKSDKIFAPSYKPPEISHRRKPSQSTKGLPHNIDRIEAIKNTSNSLQTRLQLEAQRLASAVPLVASKWNKPREEVDFVSRYQHMTGQAECVFDDNLPGVRDLYSEAHTFKESDDKTRAATKIQAAFRGHNVRQSLTWRYPEHKTIGYKSNRDFCLHDSDVLSDSTLTEDSLSDDRDDKKLSVVPPYVPARGIKPSKPIPAWDQQSSDPYTFFSVYSRKKNTLHKPRIPTPPLSDDDDEEMRELTEPPPPPPIPIIPMPSKIHKARAQSPTSLTSDTRCSIEERLQFNNHSDSDVTKRSRSSSHTQKSHKENSFGDKLASRSRGDGVVSDDDDDDTLNRTLTESTSSETSSKLKNPSQSRSLAQSSKDKVISVVDKDTDWSDVSSLTDESDAAFHNVNTESKLTSHGNQWSPGVLHHRMLVELNYLDGIEQSLQQMTHVERTRGVSMAQQETVSLAQLLKAQKQAHAIDIAELEAKVHQENQQRAAQSKVLPKQDLGTQYSLHEPSKYSRTDTQYSRTDSQYTGTEEQLSSYTSDSYESTYTKSLKMTNDSKKSFENEVDSLSELKTADDSSKSSSSTIKTGPVSTASDVSFERKSNDSSIHTELDLKDEADLSKSESVVEEICSEHDYTADFDTEEELECSLREMLPSEGQRKKLKRQTSKDLSAILDDVMPSDDQVSSRRLSFEDDSFSRFNVDMVRQYLKDDEIRERHQHALLKLREQALVEKTKAELAWLEQQKKQIKRKGADDAYPRLKQKERGIRRRLKQEQAELKRLQEVQRAASRKRLLMLKESQEIVKMQKSAQQVREKLKDPVKSSVCVSEITSDVITDDEPIDVSSQPQSPSKEKSDSEIAESFHKLKLMKLDTKFMTRREKKLQQRKEVTNIEKQKTDKRKSTQHVYEKPEGADAVQLATPRTPRTESIQESIHAEKTENSASVVTPSERRSTQVSVSEDVSSSTPSTVKKSQFASFAERLSAAPSSVRTKSCLNTAADSSIQEANQIETDVEYSNDTFEYSQTQAETERTRNSQISSSPATPKTSDGRYASSPNNNVQKNSESDSEELFSVVQSETSDTSDVKARIRELSEELKQRKIEAERLKKQHEQKQKEKLRQREEYLRKQIENYDNYISHVKTELSHGVELPERSGTSVRRQIKPQSETSNKTNKPKSLDKGQHSLDTGITTGGANSVISKNKTEKQTKRQENEAERSAEKLLESRDEIKEVTRSESLEKSELKLDLDEKNDDQVQVASPRSVHESKLDTARSVTEIPEDISLQIDQSEKSVQPTPRLEDIAESSHQMPSKKSEPGEENSEASEASYAGKSGSYQSESFTSSERSRTYTDDYSDESESSATVSTRTRSERSVEQANQGRSEQTKSVPTQDDLSESLIEEEQLEEESKSEVLFQLTDMPQLPASEDADHLNIGDRVAVDDKLGTLEFKDFVRFAPGLHGGVALDGAVGDNDGTVEGVSYFTCQPQHGVIVPINKITKLDEEPQKLGSEEQKEAVVDDNKVKVDTKEVTEKEDDVLKQEDSTAAEKEQPPESRPQDQAPPQVSSPDTEVKDNESKVKECENVTNLTVENLLNEAISQMMEIRSRKRTTLKSEPSAEEQTANSGTEPQQVTESVDTDPEPIQRPISPQQCRSDAFVDDDPYDFTDEADDPWNDDDLGFGISRKASAEHPAVIDAAELRLDLSKLNEPVRAEPVLYLISHTEPDVNKLVSAAVDVFWERRRYGESWSDVEPPPSYHSSTEDGTELDVHSQRVYKRLVFDLTGHVLRDLYKDEEEDAERPAWARSCLPKYKYAVAKRPPTTVDALRPLARGAVCRLLGLGPEGRPDGGQPRKWSTRKKKDRVDEILVQELREDEPQWVNYDDDELAVKMQVTNTLFEALLADTVGALGPAIARWRHRTS